jgi:hypothetical protein
VTNGERLADRISPFSSREFLQELENSGLIRLRAALDVEMKRRGIANTVGQVAEELAIEFFKRTPGRPTLTPAATGTKNVDALSQDGERYSIKCICGGRKTGTIYPDRENRDRQLFEYLLVVKLDQRWSLEAIYEFDWKTFCEIRSWDSRMNAWYVSGSARTLAKGTMYCP